MLATMIEPPSPGSRSELLRIPTAELPRLVDRILDNRASDREVPAHLDPASVTVAPAQAPGSRSLLAVIRRLLERSPAAQPDA